MSDLKRIALELLRKWASEAERAIVDGGGPAVGQAAMRQAVRAEEGEYIALLNNYEPVNAEPSYEYSFSVWPDSECSRWTPSTYKLFAMLSERLTIDFTARDFRDFREALAKQGFTLREISRRPSAEQETVL